MKFTNILTFVTIIATSVVSAFAHGRHDEERAIQRLDADKNYQQLRVTLTDRPADVLCACKLARLCLKKGSTTRARRALAPWWKMKHVPQEVILTRATILQRDHFFPESLSELSLLIQLNPKHAEAWLMKSTIHAVCGDYEEAYTCALPLFGIASPVIASTATANALSLSGKASESYQLLAKRLSMPGSNDSPETLCWAWTTLAEIAVRLGKNEEARQHFETALLTVPRNQYARVTYGEFLIASGEPQAAWRLIRPTVSGEAETLVLALAEKAMEHPQQKFADELKDQFAGTTSTGSRASARYFLDIANDPARAWQIAKANWDALQREPADTLLALRAAKAAGADAADIRSWLAKSGIEDIRLGSL